MRDYELMDDGEVPTPADIPHPRPSALPLQVLRTAPHCFQFRTTKLIEFHVADLVPVLRRGDPLDPVAVWFATVGPIVIDGHHRLEAYHRAGWTKAVPITVVEGSYSEARLYAAGENAKAKLALTPRERADAAWALVTSDFGFSQRKIAAAANVSLGTVNGMVKVVKRLREKGEDPASITSWAAAKRRANDEPDREYDDEQLEAWAREWCDRLAKAFGPKAQSQPDVFARALEMYFGDRLPSLIAALPQPEPEDEDDDAF